MARAKLKIRFRRDRRGWEVDYRGPELLRKVGSPGWTRTSDILINSQALYRLSYRGMPVNRRDGNNSTVVTAAATSGSARRARGRPGRSPPGRRARRRA